MSPTPRFGLGFRTQHFAELTARPRGVDWLELLADNFLGVGGPRRAQLERLRADFPLALHGVSLGIANDAPPRPDYVAALRELAELVQPLFVSDHLCWTGLGGRNSHDLLPVAGTREVLALVSARVARVQDTLGRRLLLENASAYVKFRGEEMSEAELLAALSQRTGCGVLLDINNLYVNAMNLGADPNAALAAFAPEQVAYMHIAGHTLLPDVRIDTHGATICEDVWRLFERAVRRFPNAHVMLERDDAIPSLADLVSELELARERWSRARAADRTTLPHAERPRVPRPHAEPAIETRASVPPWRESQRELWAGIEVPATQAEWDAEPLSLILDAGLPVAPERGLRVYRDSYRTFPERALAANFPTLARVLSRRDFAALSAAFARARPSTSHEFLDFGAALAEFVETFAFADCYGVDAAAFADIARLEQAQLEAQEAANDSSVVAPEALAALEPEFWEDARFGLSRALRIVRARWDVLPAVRAVAAGDKPALPKRVEAAYLVARTGGEVRTRALDAIGARALAALAHGATFAEACEACGGEAAAAPAARALALVCGLGALRTIHAAASCVGGALSA